MKKIITLLAVFVVALSSLLPVSAASGKVKYSKNAGEFIFKPGSDYSVTDLFPNFKDVMPGDEITQSITVKNNADKKVKVKIYLRSLGAHLDSAEFLSQLNLKVAKSKKNKMAYMFDATLDETAQLTDWVCIGTLYSGGEVNLDLTLDVPVELTNEYQDKIGYLDWEFMVEELTIDPDDPKAPQTGDNSNTVTWFVLMLCSVIIYIIILLWLKKDKKKEKEK